MTPKCTEYPKVRWSAPNPDALTRQSPIVLVQSPKSDGEIRQRLMVLNRLEAQILFSLLISRVLSPFYDIAVKEVYLKSMKVM